MTWDLAEITRALDREKERLALAQEKQQRKAKRLHAKTTLDTTSDRYPLSDEFVHLSDDGIFKS